MREKYFPKLREICLGLPGAKEVQKWDHPTFVARGEIFLAMGFSSSYPFVFSFKPSENKLDMYFDDDRIVSARHYGDGAWLGFDLSVHEVDWSEVSDVISSSYEIVLAN